MREICIYACLILVCITLLTGCAGSSAPAAKPSGDAVLSAGVMTTAVDDDSRPIGGILTTFPADTAEVYCSFKVAGVVPEDMIKASLVYLKGEAEGLENSMIYETYMIVESADSEYYLAFFFSKPASGWNRGDYKVVLSVNNREKLSIPFAIQ